MAHRDSLLVQRARLGDPNAIGEIYETYQPAVFSYIYYRLGNVAASEDLTAEVFVRLVTNVRTYEDRGKPILAWLYTIARNLVVNFLRHEKCLEILPLDENTNTVEDDAPHTGDDGRLAQHEIKAALDKLTEPQRQVVWLKFIEGYSNAEIASIVGRDENAVKSLQHRALAAMRRTIAIAPMAIARSSVTEAPSIRKERPRGEERSHEC